MRNRGPADPDPYPFPANVKLNQCCGVRIHEILVRIQIRGFIPVDLDPVLLFSSVTFKTSSFLLVTF
jgi:hypothetical protein